MTMPVPGASIESANTGDAAFEAEGGRTLVVAAVQCQEAPYVLCAQVKPP